MEKLLTKRKIKKLDEKRVIEQAKENPEKFKPLYDWYYEEIFHFIFKKIGEKEIAGDVCAEVFYKALVNLKDYKITNSSFVAWLYRVAINEVTAFFRKTKKERLVVLGDHQIHFLQEELKYKNLDEEEMRYYLGKAFQQLKSLEVVLLELRFYEEKSFKEIGEILSITENNAKVKTYRILDKLKIILKKIDAYA
ncbi:MAG: sigma-70 family RNA polymerase sigma factor [Bacteroidota bacterium]